VAVTAIDWLALAVVVVSLLLGAWRGLLYEVLALAGWVLAFVAARWAAAPVGQWLPMGESPEPLRHAVGFVLVFVATAFACGLLAALARRASRALGVRPVDRSFGALFGLLRGALLLLLVAVAVRLAAWHQEPWWIESVSARWLELALLQLHPFLPESFSKWLSA